MGGYAAFIWPSYAVTLVLLAGLAFASILVMRARERELRRLEEAGAGRRAAPRTAQPSGGGDDT